MTAQSVVLIDRGDLPSLVAAMLETEPSRLVLWHMCERGAGGEGRLAAVREHADVLGVRRLIVAELGSLGVADLTQPVGLYFAHLLLHAVTLTTQLGARKIVWPHQVGPEAQLVTEAVDRANQVAALAATGGQPSSLVVDLPLIDLSDPQVVDLADDTGAPLRAFWPCQRDGPEPCESCRGCTRWRGAFREADVAWPWSAVATE